MPEQLSPFPAPDINSRVEAEVFGLPENPVEQMPIKPLDLSLMPEKQVLGRFEWMNDNNGYNYLVGDKLYTNLPPSAFYEHENMDNKGTYLTELNPLALDEIELGDYYMYGRGGTTALRVVEHEGKRFFAGYKVDKEGADPEVTTRYKEIADADKFDIALHLGSRDFDFRATQSNLDQAQSPKSHTIKAFNRSMGYLPLGDGFMMPTPATFAQLAEEKQLPVKLFSAGKMKAGDYLGSFAEEEPKFPISTAEAEYFAHDLSPAHLPVIDEEVLDASRPLADAVVKNGTEEVKKDTTGFFDRMSGIPSFALQKLGEGPIGEKGIKSLKDDIVRYDRDLIARSKDAGVSPEKSWAEAVLNRFRNVMELDGIDEQSKANFVQLEARYRQFPFYEGADETDDIV